MAYMPNYDYITPMTQRSIFFIVYPGFELLDLSGPLAVFSAANTLTNRSLYDVKTLSSTGGMVTSGAGLNIETLPMANFPCTSTATFLVVGSHGKYLKAASKDTTLCNWLLQQSASVERFGSVCTGAFVLHAAGLLDEKTVTTHWAGSKHLRKLKSKQTVLEDALYYIDGKCWTSAGVTTGIDMALEMLKRDHGQELMLTVSQYLVVYTQRPGNQSQFAVVKEMKSNEEDDFSNLVNWLKKEILRPVRINEMADFMCMSERSFQRRFSAHFATSPSRFYERMRMEYARDFLLPRHTIEVAARLLGFGSVAAFRTSFKKHFGVSPSICKQIR